MNNVAIKVVANSRRVSDAEVARVVKDDAYRLALAGGDKRQAHHIWRVAFEAQDNQAARADLAAILGKA